MTRLRIPYRPIDWAIACLACIAVGTAASPGLAQTPTPPASTPANETRPTAPAPAVAGASLAGRDLRRMFDKDAVDRRATSHLLPSFPAGDNAYGIEPPETVPWVDLTRARQAAVLFSRDTRMSQARLEQATAMQKQARGLLLPNVALRYSRGVEISAPSAAVDSATGQPLAKERHMRDDTSLVIRQPVLDLPALFDWRRRERIEAGRREEIRASRSEASGATTTAYLDLVAADLITTLALDYEKQLDQFSDYVQKRAGAGAASNADRDRVLARGLAARAARIQQESATTSAAIEFSRLTNLLPASLQIPAADALPPVPENPAEAQAIAFVSNPDLAALQAAYDAATTEIQMARARYAPTLAVELSQTLSNNAGGTVGQQNDRRLMLVMNWSLFNGGSDYYFARENAARLTELYFQMDEARRRIAQTLASSYASLAATREQIASGYRELDAIVSASQAMSQKMLSGNQSLLDLLDVQDRQHQARVRLVNLHTQELREIGRIGQLLGTDVPLSGEGSRP